MNSFLETPKHIIKSNEQDVFGIMSREKIESIQEDLCDIIQYPTTIIDNNIDEATNKYVRIDSSRSSFIYCEACSAFRICDDAMHCLESDNYHAGFFFKYNKEVLSRNPQTIKECINSYFLCQDFPFQANYHPECKEFSIKNEQLHYLQYICPIMGLTELLFPIVIEGSIIAVIFIGQLYIKSMEEQTKDCRNFLLYNFNSRFELYFQKNNISIEIQDFIKSKITTVNDEKKPSLYDIPGDQTIKTSTIGHKRQVFDNFEELEQYINQTIIPQIIELHHKIKDILQKKRDSYINFIINNATANLQLGVETINNRDSSIIIDFWKKVSTNINSFQNEIGINFFALYSFDKNVGYFKLCSKSEEFDNYSYTYTFPDSFYLYKRDARKLKNQIISDELFLKKVGFLNLKNNMVICHELLTQIFILVIDFKNNNICNNKIYEDLLRKHLKQYLTNIMHEYAIVSNIVEAELTKKTLRIYRHEISHLNLGLTGVYSYFENPNELHQLSNEKILDIHNDFKSCIDVMNYMTSEIGVFTGAITKTENISFEEFKIYKELIWKWKTLYRDELKKDYKRIRTVTDEKNWDEILAHRPLIKSDKKLLEVIIYNIVNNAIKYSYSGTNIHIDCNLINKTQQCFSVIDYGNAISNTDLPYQLYFRDENIKDYAVEGNGIGLFVSKKAAEIIGVKIQHRCRKISDYNIPLLRKWIEIIKKESVSSKEKQGKDILMADIVNMEICRLQKTEEYNLIVSELANCIPVEQVKNELCFPTYEVIFEVII